MNIGAPQYNKQIDECIYYLKKVCNKKQNEKNACRMRKWTITLDS